MPILLPKKRKGDLSMSRRIVLSLAIAIAALLLGLILAFFSRRVSPP